MLYAYMVRVCMLVVGHLRPYNAVYSLFVRSLSAGVNKYSCRLLQ